MTTKKSTHHHKKKTATTKRTSSKKTKKRTTPAKKRSVQRRVIDKHSKIKTNAVNSHQKTFVFGVVLVFVTAILVLSLLSPNQGEITPVLAHFIKQLFGFGRATIPLLIGAIGIYLILVGMENRPYLPPRRLYGAGLLFGVVEASASLWVFTKSLADFWLLAEQGRGGGYFGSFLAFIMYKLVGDLGSFVVYLLLAIIAIWLLVPMAFIQLFARRLEPLQSLFNASNRQIEPLQVKERLAHSPAFRRAKKSNTPDTTMHPASPLQNDLPRAEVSLKQKQQQAEQPVSTISDTTMPAQKVPAPAVKQATKVAEALDGEEIVEPLHKTIQTVPSSQWVMPQIIDILEPGSDPEADEELIKEQASIIEETLTSFGAPVNIVKTRPGPIVTQFGVEPGYILQRSGKRQKVKVSKIAGLADDLALALAAKSVRVQAPVPGEGFVGIEVPGASKVVVSLRDVMESPSFDQINSPLRIGLGKDVAGKSIGADLAKMPHLLVAGATGSGKSVCVNAIIACLLLQNSPNDLRFVMVDPKRVELTGYNNIPHMAAPVVVEMDKVIGVLMWALREMDSRYQAFAKAGARNIKTYNKKMVRSGKEKLPYIVIVIDELADLMMTSPEDTERALARLAQMARATGMHMIIATQRPSVDVVTGLIKANFPARIAFAVSSSTDSRVILDQTGAERLLGQGDMLIQKPDAPAPIRMQGCYVSDDELNSLIAYWKSARRTNSYTVSDAKKKRKEKKESPIITVQPIEVERMIAKERDQQIAFEEVAPPPVKLEIKKVDKKKTASSATTLNRRPVSMDKPAVDQKQKGDPLSSSESTAAKNPMPLLDIEKENKQKMDALWGEAIAFVQSSGKASTSMLQRNFRIGYTRAARIIDAMEDEGIIGPPTGTSKAREVLWHEPPEKDV